MLSKGREQADQQLFQDRTLLGESRHCIEDVEGTDQAIVAQAALQGHKIDTHYQLQASWSYAEQSSSGLILAHPVQEG